ncbi:hypothetical protein BJ165DRAFT_1417138 [Panaeolus papilionaceus]|nr:hypothetical protein BJ165DRAFT_1417138 [Panaeolus papilionaceus]
MSRSRKAQSGPRSAEGGLTQRYFHFQQMLAIAFVPERRENNRSSYLDELCRQAGRGEFMKASNCPDCVASCVKESRPALYRCCSECLIPDLTCCECCVRRHRKLPLHRIEMWNGEYFAGVSLKSLGLTIQLNHTSMHCPVPIKCHENMVVLHTNGLHEVAFEYCGCGRGEPQHVQLLRRQFYPASQLTIQTCAMFELLDLLHKLSLTTKASMYDFYRGLEKLTDNTGLQARKHQYRALYRMAIQWRHLKMLKWAGRAHDPGGPDATEAGALGVACPSCPYPGINLPEGWDKAPESMRFLYMAFLCMDANFRLKNQLISNWSQDPGLGVGLAYMLPRTDYEAYVSSMTSDSDVSSCVGFQAIVQANTRFSQGLRYTGVGAVLCGRSEMVLPQGVGNLHKGERYSNMDYIFASAVQSFLALTTVLISYNIACQWFVNLYGRMAKHWPAKLQIPQTTKLIPAIPKLHEPMHEAKNHQTFSLNYVPH